MLNAQRATRLKQPNRDTLEPVAKMIYFETVLIQNKRLNLKPSGRIDLRRGVSSSIGL